jgi:sigma-54 dependent transcriptional regulator, acetoin dehydrogenase operon transcriptional activator AcoR
VVAMRDNRMVLLRLPEVSFAESHGNDVWLSTTQGRLRAAAVSLDKLDSDLADAGFLRVHRRYVVNLSRIREIERGLKGELSLMMDDRKNEMVPVSRRNAPALRRALDI